MMATAINPLDTALQEQEQVPLEHLISACGNLVYLDEKADVLRFVHFSVQEFLKRQPELKDAEGFVTDVCYTALSFPQRPAAIWGYAADNWLRHTRCWREISGDRGTLIERFLLAAPRLKEWVTYFTKRAGQWKGIRHPFSWYGAIGVCASFNLPVVLDHLLQRNAENFGEDFPESVSAALLLAAAGGYFSVADLLVKAGANTRWQMANFGVSLRLERQSSYGMEAMLQAIAASNGLGSATALQVAAGGGHEEVVKLLLKADADVNCMCNLRVSLSYWSGNDVGGGPGIIAMDMILISKRR